MRAEIVDVVPVHDLAVMALVQTDYVEGESERYLLSVGAALGRRGEELAARSPGAVLARLRDDKGAPAGVLYDAVCDREFCESLLDVMGRRSAVKAGLGELEGWSDRQIRKTTRQLQADRVPGQVTVAAGDASVTFGSRFVLRLIRRPEDEHPDLEPILQSTYGVFVYQEQVMAAAHKLAGFSLGQADELRRAMGKKIASEMESKRAAFIEGCTKRRIAAGKAEKIFQTMEKFAGYGFNSSHSTAYALLAYQCAWLKAHYPAEFMAATMTSEMSDSARIVTLIEVNKLDPPADPEAGLDRKRRRSSLAMALAVAAAATGLYFGVRQVVARTMPAMPVPPEVRGVAMP